VPEQKSHGGPGDRGGVGVLAGHRFCADSMVGYWRKRTPGRPRGQAESRPGGHASILNPYISWVCALPRCDWREQDVGVRDVKDDQ